MIARRPMCAMVVLLCSLVGCLSFSAPAALAMTPPVIEEESVLDVASTSATFRAAINPQGSETTYRFEYGTSETYGTDIPAPDGIVGVGEAAIPVQAHPQDLQPHTIYHFRVVATNAEGSTPSTDQTFTTQTAGGELVLPDERQWELVSPPNKEGALLEGITFEGSPVQASTGGEAMAYAAAAPTEANPEGSRSPEDMELLATRGPDGWSSKDIAPPHNGIAPSSVGQGQEYRFFSTDLAQSIVEPRGQTLLSPQATEQTIYLRDSVSGVFTPLVTAANVAEGVKFGEDGYGRSDVEFIAATPDADHVVLESGVPLTAGGGSLYEWNAGEEQPSEPLQPLYVLPEGEGGGVVGGGAPSSFDHQFSDDGSAFFGYEGHIYLQHADKRKTLRLRFAPGAPSEGEASFVYASSDGSRLLFRDSEQLTSAPGGGVYECQIAEVAGQLTCAQLSLTGLSFEGVLLGGSEDASRLYFADTVTDTLFVDRLEGSGWKQTAIATLSGEDERDWSGELVSRTSRVSPNGEWFAFMSQESLTGYDNLDVNGNVPDEEVYVYDANSGRLACASCNPTGARPDGVQAVREGFRGPYYDVREFWGGHWLAATVPGWTGMNLSAALYQSRYLSDSGRLFFNSFDALVPQDTNGELDVYEYEPAGIGSCQASSVTFSASSGGCVGLISSGASGEESAFVDASESGNDVFFLTSAQLAPQDIDNAYDMYDAHSCSTESPCTAAAVTPPACTTTDSCRAAPMPQPGIFGAPSSATFSGSGNPAPVVVKTATPTKPKAKPLTRAQKLARALRDCRSRPKRRRAACKAKARKLSRRGNR